MFELGQTVVYDIRIFSLRKSAFIYYVFFLQSDEDNTFSGYHGVGGRLRGMKPLFWLTIGFNLTSALFESRMF